MTWFGNITFLQDPGGRANQLEGENAHQVNPPCGSRWQSAMEGPRWPPLFRNIQGRSTWAGKVIYFSPKIKKTIPCRLSLALEPDTRRMTTAPGMGLKFSRDGVHSANLVAMFSVGGQESWNFFKNDFSNHIPG